MWCTGVCVVEGAVGVVGEGVNDAGGMSRALGEAQEEVGAVPVGVRGDGSHVVSDRDAVWVGAVRLGRGESTVE